ncbi:uncharacterized protein LOC113272227 [Papaver somniferum]|uniref:uncharacterized protein LOC113272227 n=1 Tax=Papaver somniferum TaxID=3469 RepID=UPI000E6FC401|nr:uncharacterized protein LOC113272227 [Papaver somniferum]
MISWNCQGIGKLETKNSLLDILDKDNPNILFLSETKQQHKEMENIMKQVNVQNYFLVTPRGIAGDLCLIWKTNVKLQIEDFAFNHINASVTNHHNDNSWTLTCFNGSPYRRFKLHSWNIISQMAETINKPWIIIGDLKVVLHEEGKESRYLFKRNEARTFNNLINDCNLMDLGFMGYTYTWNNHRQDTQNIEQRLDGALVNDKCNRKFPNSSITHLGPLTSDHLPIKLNTYNQWDDGPTLFKYFWEWIKHEESKPLIQESWNKNIKGSASHKVNKNLVIVKHTLNLWNKTSFGNINSNIQNIKKDMEKTNSMGNYPNKITDLANLRQDLAKWYAIKQKFWKDKSRDQNIALGDRNTRFFHNKAKQRFGSNRIETLKDENNVWLNTKEIISDCITKHFHKIASTVNPEIDKNVTNLILTSVNLEDNEILCASPLENEIKKTLFSMEPDKNPGPDGFPPNLFQQNWEIIKIDVTATVQNFFITGHISKEMNASFISLILKNLNPTTPAEFRPIALANTCYKIISKLMAGRMKGLLEKLISPYQSAFISGRQISENITLAHEIIYKMKKSKSKKGFTGLKIDMSKAFDRVEWDFLMKIMNKKGFNSKWCNL